MVRYKFDSSGSSGETDASKTEAGFVIYIVVSCTWWTYKAPLMPSFFNKNGLQENVPSLKLKEKEYI